MQPENSRLPEPRRATGMPTYLLAAQHRIRLDGSLTSTQSFSLPFEPGEIINGKYRVQELIGVGGVGFVVAATHMHLDDSVALKILKPEFASHPEAVRSFTLEARASFRIKSEHVARVYDVDSLPNGVPFMVMELLQGDDLRSILKRHRYLSIDLAVDLVLQTCEALATAHACQIVHRDVKPENLFVTHSADASHIKVLDFGISQVLISANQPAEPDATAAMVAVGTPPYMSPEQIRGSNDLDARADLWSLGCVLYELLTGIAPFARMSIMQSCAAVLEDEPPPLRENRPDAPPELEEVVMRCMRKDPSQRFSNAAELAAALAPFGRNSGYCADRCAALLSKDVRHSEPGARRADLQSRRANTTSLRVPTSTHAPVRRLPTHTDFRPSSPAKRRPTMSPLSTPVVFGARKASSLALARPLPAPPPPVVIDETPVAIAIEPPVILDPAEDDLDFVPGLRPTKMRWLVIAASASIALGAAYITASELSRNGPSRLSLQPLRERLSTALGPTNAQAGSTGFEIGVGASNSDTPQDP
jgi:serine/threonine-protein kinase